MAKREDLQKICKAQSTRIRAWSTVASFLGYAVLLGMFNISLLVILASCPLTLWNDDESSPLKADGLPVPSLNEHLFWTGMCVPMGISATLGVFFYRLDASKAVSTGDSGWQGAKISGSVWTVCLVLCLVLLPLWVLSTGRSLCSRAPLSIIIILLFWFASVIIDKKCITRSIEKASDALKTQSAKKAKKGAFFKFITTLSGMSTLALYPLILIPIYLESSDLFRILFVCFIHPVIQELNLTGIRIGRIDYNAVNDLSTEDKIQYVTNKYVATPFVFEAIQVNIRRFLMASMASSTSTTIAIILTGIEEVVLRSTLISRDEYVKRRNMKGKRKHIVDKSRVVENVVWTIAIGNSMITEILAIINTAAVTILLQPHRYIFPIGAGLENVASAMFFFNVALELFTEVLVDLIAVKGELEHEISVHAYFNIFPTAASTFAHICYGACGLLLILCFTAIVPNTIFCDDYTNVCSCNLDIFKAYQPFCNSTGGNTTLYNLTLMEKEGSKGVLSTLDEDDVSVLAIGLISVVCILAVSSASAHMLKARKQNVKIASIASELENAQNQVRNLRKELSIEQQVNVAEVMDERLDSLKHYVIGHESVELQEKLGDGSFGEVFKGTLGTSTVAVKKLRVGDVDNFTICRFRDECLLMADLQDNLNLGHDNVIRMVSVCWDKELLLIIEYADMGSLDSVVEKAAENGSKYHDELRWNAQMFHIGPMYKLLVGIINGMEYIHENGIIHRDLKPENVLVASGWVAKIADFGESRKVDNETMTQTGTPFYVAPEIMTGDRYDHRADIYSFSMVVLYLCSFREGGLMKMWRKSLGQDFNIVKGPIAGKRPHIPENTPRALSALMKACWDKTVSSRPASFKAVGDLLKHGAKSKANRIVRQVTAPISALVFGTTPARKSRSFSSTLGEKIGPAKNGLSNKSSNEETFRGALEQAHQRISILETEIERLRDRTRSRVTSRVASTVANE